jgi:hypothetical protein
MRGWVAKYCIIAVMLGATSSNFDSDHHGSYNLISCPKGNRELDYIEDRDAFKFKFVRILRHDRCLIQKPNACCGIFLLAHGAARIGSG